MLPYGLAAFLYGPLIRAFDARRIELICIFFFSLANLLAGLSADISTLFIARFLMGFFGASVIPLGLILIGRSIPQEARGRYIGIFFSTTFLASLLGLFLSGIIHWRLIFLIPAAAGFILWVKMYYSLPSFKEEKGTFRFNYHLVLKNKRVIRLFTYILFISLIYHGVQQWLGVYFSTRLHLNQFKISMLITLTSFSGVVGEVWGGSLADSLGRKRVISLGVLAMIAAVFLLLIKLPALLLAAVMVVWGLGWTFNHVGLSTMLTDLPKDFLNEAASLNSGVRFLAGGIGVSLSGLIMHRSFTLGFIIFGAALVLILFSGNMLNSKEV
jgi:predicted MFS family arabinose efflux permease